MDHLFTHSLHGYFNKEFSRITCCICLEKARKRTFTKTYRNPTQIVKGNLFLQLLHCSNCTRN